MSIQKIMEVLDTKEGLMLLITQMIKDTPNDKELGFFIRKAFSNLEEE